MEQKVLTNPTPRQALALICPANELLFGGARGGGKSYGGIIDFMKQIPVLGGRSKGIAFRKTYRELDDIVEKCKDLLVPLDFAYHKGDNYFQHPSGAKYILSYMERPEDAESHQGFAYSHIFFDEIGNYKSLNAIELMKATLRGYPIPPRMFLTANPGGRAHELIKARYPIKNPMTLSTDEDGWIKAYVPSLFTDNHHLVANDPNYIKRATSGLPEYLRQAWRFGNWDISTDAGMFFSVEDFANQYVDINKLPGMAHSVRCWDRAASEPSKSYPDPDYTAGVKIGLSAAKDYYITDIKLCRKRSAHVRDLIMQTAIEDGKNTTIILFQDPGQAGKGEAEDMKRFLSAYPVKVMTETGAKHTRWKSFSSGVQNQIVYIVRARWNQPYIDEAVQLTDNPDDYPHDDMTDAASGAYNYLAQLTIDTTPGVFRGHAG